MRDLIEEENLDSRVQDGLRLFLETGEGTTTEFNLLTDSVDLLTYWSNDWSYLTSWQVGFNFGRAR